MSSTKQKVATAAASKLPGFCRIPSKCLVTGGSGFVGQRLVEMLIERGASKVVSFDISPKPKDAMEDSKIQYIQGDLTKPDEVVAATEGVDCVFHIAALVGPYHHKDAYVKVNFEGTRNVLDACKHWGVKKIVMSSSPSTRFPYPDPDIDGLTEDDLQVINGGDFAPVFLQPYAETKAQGEKLVRDACGSGDSDDDLLTIAVAPHQVLPFSLYTHILVASGTFFSALSTATLFSLSVYVSVCVRLFFLLCVCVGVRPQGHTLPA